MNTMTNSQQTQPAAIIHNLNLVMSQTATVVLLII